MGRSPAARDAGLRTPSQLHPVGPGKTGAHNVPKDRAVRLRGIWAFNHYDKSNKYKVDKDFSSARVGDYDGLVILVR